MNLVALVLLAITLLSIVIAARAVAREHRSRLAVAPQPVERIDPNQIISNLPAVVWEVSGDRLEFISDHVTRMLGYTVEECMSAPDLWRTIVQPDGRVMTKDGRAIRCEAHSTVIQDEQGNPIGMRGLTLEISARKRAVPRVVELPAIPEQVSSSASPYPDLRHKQILVVDREAASLDFTAELLRQCGARVTIARSATEAILALYQHHDLVVTDNAVPVTEGVMLAQQLRQANGGLPAIVLRKPVDAIELASEIAQVLR